MKKPKTFFQSGPRFRRAAVLGAALMTAGVFASAPALASERTPSVEGAAVYIIAPADGATVSGPVLVQFGLRGMGVAPANMETIPKTGHHHLLVNKPLQELDIAQALPADENHIHYGGGQTEALLQLPPGTHTLQLLFADWQHVPHDPPLYSEVVTITVE